MTPTSKGGQRAAKPKSLKKGAHVGPNSRGANEPMSLGGGGHANSHCPFLNISPHTGQTGGRFVHLSIPGLFCLPEKHPLPNESNRRGGGIVPFKDSLFLARKWREGYLPKANNQALKSILPIFGVKICNAPRPACIFFNACVPPVNYNEKPINQWEGGITTEQWHGPGNGGAPGNPS